MSQRLIESFHAIRGFDAIRRPQQQDSPGVPRRSVGRLGATAVLLAAPVVVVVIAAWMNRHMGDDGFINLRIVRQILQGHGPVFNQGQRVEAFTSPAWLVILTVADVVLPFRLEWSAVGIGIAALGAGVALATVGAVRLHGSTDRTKIFVPAGAALVAALAPVWRQAPNGQELGLSFAWLGAACFVLARWAQSRRRISATGAAVIGFGPLVRPDLALFTVVFLVVLLVGGVDESWTSRVRTVAWALGLPVAYEIFRMGYYGVLVPNTALAKSAGGSRWGMGWSYLRDTIDPYWLWVPLLALALGCLLPIVVQTVRDSRGSARSTWVSEHRAFAVSAGFVVAGALTLLYMVKIGGDYVHSRLLLPALFGLVAPFAAVPLRRRYVATFVILPWAVVCMLWLRSPADRHVAIEGPKHGVTLEDFGWQRGGPNATWYAGAGIYNGTRKIDAVPPTGSRPVIISFGIGIASYSLGPDVDVFDVLGLAQPIAAHEELRRRGYPGHEKILPAPWVAALVTAPNSPLNAADYPTAPPPISVGFKVARLVDQDDPRGRPFDERVQAARDTLRCARLRDFIASYTDPMGPDRFVENIWSSLSNTRLKIPAEPADARAALCRGH